MSGGMCRPTAASRRSHGLQARGLSDFEVGLLVTVRWHLLL